MHLLSNVFTKYRYSDEPQGICTIPIRWRIIKYFGVSLLQLKGIKIRSYNNFFAKLPKNAAVFLCSVHRHNILSKFTF
uniref:Uncharacterized protein n=1 Tax=Lotus japonicus TaxID=34305 RepID=I3SQ84_LOTJA|nr:unknown [Lotus japonicus]